ncbi:helix-turn-helix transcriptional regulator [Clostridium tertium]|jgi:transcriptional regulator with XRE-family HTH domain|uniref:helix-turn-helix domain-containing protein n=1 Tax=Clostridium TaxID=1485 RepID=UPI001C1E07E8|nr:MULTISPECIES: helix-turn-helix transcriptional regulator [Clostridium]MBU6134897.1 helix-turn-helix transcriptional regulator [Clostridium tertium]MDB1956600.1 helix-turn-helix transcriptional regulator [Clostridium tertium]MDB1958471.1 helix-turn-helix transcriptional regulator [Clostridium tertium]MDB1962362.1 helix-turn-helix transcriptional regulator [Clostridium tertium]MDB1967652.1 helix-turn-helix transcriptional regulator [Clostridium tertium]
MLGEKVKTLRKALKITQKELAIAVGVSQSTIGMIEGNKQGASNDTLLKLAKALNTTVDNLLSSDSVDNEVAENIEISKKAEKDIAKTLEKTLEELENSQDGLMFSGEPLDEETRELLKISLENSMRLAKQIAKQKFTPKKYK